MCDGGCGKLLWCDIPCAVSPLDNMVFNSCQIFIITTVIILSLLSVYLYSALSSSKDHKGELKQN